MSQKPAIPKGTRDFLPNDVLKRKLIFSTIADAFQRFGYQPIETPSFELSTTLMGKYGDEGDRLIFRILNSGEKVRKADLEALAADNLPRFANSLSEKALRYDLTVPFARFVVQHQNELSFPFKRYQIQPVWRLDKLDKIGEDGVIKELMDKGFDSSLVDSIKPLFQLKGSFEERISFLSTFLSQSEIGMKGLEELSYIYSKFKENPLKKGQLELDVTLARGLNYYTGAIIEVKAHEVEMGSICGGGRYDDLTGLFGVKGLSGVGISFGADRIYDIMETLGLFPADLSSGPDILFLNFSEEEADQCAIWANTVRDLGKVAEVYPSQAKLQKQLKYANDKGVKWVLFYGEEERQKGIVIVKQMESGEQYAYSASAWLSSWEG